MGMDCIFCKIRDGEIPKNFLFEDSAVMAFDDIHPKAPIHILVVVKEHIQSIAHLETNHSDVIAKLIYTAKHIATEKGLEGYKLLFNVGRAGGQVIDHLHLHLLGGWNSSVTTDYIGV
jgi:histidine triad (HIT) family protein